MPCCCVHRAAAAALLPLLPARLTSLCACTVPNQGNLADLKSTNVQPTAACTQILLYEGLLDACA